MELKTFIKETLAQIVEGVKEAQEITADTGAMINPVFYHPMANENLAAGDRMNASKEIVEFDIKLIVSEQSEKVEKIGVSVVGIKLGSGGGKSAETSSINSVKFSIPIVFPEQRI